MDNNKSEVLEDELDEDPMNLDEYDDEPLPYFLQV